MKLIDLLLIAVALSMDAFAVSVCKGLNTKKRFMWPETFICFRFYLKFIFS